MIRAREVRLIGPNGDQVGILSSGEAQKYADQLELDLVEVAPEARPPVCKVMDYGKYRYEQEQKGNKVKVTIMVRGRELVHPHLREVLLRRMAEDLEEIGEIESEPNLDGRNMIMMLTPRKE